MRRCAVQLLRFAALLLLALGDLLVGGPIALRVSSAQAQELIRPLLPRDGQLFDLILRSSADPDLLSSREAVMRQKLLDLGVDPRGERRRPTLATMLQRRFADRADLFLFEPPRQVEIFEVDWRNRLVVVYRFPETHLFFSEVDTNLVGLAFEPARDVADSAVIVEMDDLEGWNRSWGAIGLQDRWAQQLRTRKAQATQARQLLNFTIPIRLPRTLERIIGRGDATNIRISGQETISIKGESARRSDFVANEIQQSQSLFPTLEMRQTLRVNLDGTVGEKIKVRVAHDSEAALGAQSTSVKLSFEGDEDDIIRTIRAGDIDVTLPGSRLLGVGATKGGLFGIKVEGALGPLDFTLVTSKEQSQQNQQNFSQSGGSEEEFVIASTDFIKNRYFRLTAPFSIFFRDGGLDPLGQIHDESLVAFQPVAQGGLGWSIDINSLEFYVNNTGITTGSPDELDEGIAVLDDSGLGWKSPTGEAPTDGAPVSSMALFERSQRWRRLQRDVDWTPLQDFSTNDIIGVVMSRSYNDQTEILACSYVINDANGNPIRKVGLRVDDPSGATIDDPEDPSKKVHFFKLLKPQSPNSPFDENGVEDPFALTWEYMFRHYYDLKGRDIQPESFQLRIERNDTSLENPELDEETRTGDTGSNLPWIQIFGLDQFLTNGQPGHDGIADISNDLLFDLGQGVLQFPITTPFDPDDSDVFANSDGAVDSLSAPGKPLRARGLYARRLNTQEEIDLRKFNIVVKQTSVSSRLRLNAFNIKEGSEEVSLDGRPLTRDADYTIDYFSGEINLTGDAAAALNAQSNISVRFEVDPLFGGGRTSLSGLNLGYKLARNKTFSTTWLSQSKPNNSTKPRLGEEPSKSLVGNVAAKLQFKPSLLRKAANLLPTVDSDEETTVNLDAEVAVSLPNPNTKGTAYLEDFESVDQSNNISLNREGWAWASLPAEYEKQTGERDYGPADRAYSAWHRPVPGIKRGDLNPRLSEQERRDIVPGLELRLVSNNAGEDGQAPVWSSSEFAGIMRSLGGEIDLSQAQFLEFWFDDFTGNVYDLNGDVDPARLARRVGRLHFDFGTINEDFFWKTRPAGGGGVAYELGEWENEDINNNGQFDAEEDVGLDGKADGEETSADVVFPGVRQRPGRGSSDPAGDSFDASPDFEVSSTLTLENEFPYINGTERNRRMDSEDLSRNGFLDLQDGYFSLVLDLDDLQHNIVDVYRDFRDDPDFIAASENAGTAWRKYRLDLRDLLTRIARSDSTGYRVGTPDLSRVKYFRVWYEAPDGGPAERRFRFAEMRFLGNRWLSDHIRDREGSIVPPGGLLSEDFRLGVVNNKDNPDYVPPVFPDTRNNVAEKEQSLQFTYSDFNAGHEFRARKDIPGRLGQDYTIYDELNFFWREPFRDGAVDPVQQGLESFYWVGSDSLNYYEIAFRFDEVQTDANGWQECRVNLGQMTNVKTETEEPIEPGSEIMVKRGTVIDTVSGESYRITVRGRPDLRKVQRFYAGVRYPDSGGAVAPPLTGEVLFNEIRLKEVNREKGYAQRYAMTASIPGLAELSGDWSQTDDEFRGLNQSKGSGILNRAWSARASSRLQNVFPTFGLDVPFSVNVRRSLQLPKFQPREDIELLTDVDREKFQTRDRAESFNFQIRKPKPSPHKLMQYTLDRLSYSLSVSQSDKTSPTQDADRVSADTKINYDLRVRKGLSFKVPFTKLELRPTPNQITLATTWRYDNSNISTKRVGDTVPTNTTNQVTKTMVNNATMVFQPTRSSRGNFSISSNRNLLLDPENDSFLSLDPGKEETFNQRWSLNLKPETRLLRWLKPEFDLNAGYQENRRPGIRQRAASLDGGPERDGFVGRATQVRHVSNSSDVSLRARVDLTSWLKRRFGQKSTTNVPAARRAEAERERRRLDRRRRPEETEVPVTPPPPVSPPPGASPPDSSAVDQGTGQGEPPPASSQPPGQEQEQEQQSQMEELRRLQEQALREAQERRQAAEAERRQREGEEPPGGTAAEDSTGRAPEGPFDPVGALKGLFRPLTNLIMNMQPISSSFQQQEQSSYQHVNGRADFLYRLGFSRKPDFSGIERAEIDTAGTNRVDDDFSSENRQKVKRLSLSTQSQLSDQIRVDLNYQGRWTNREGTRGETRDRTRDWPNVSIRINGVHKWRIFGNMFSTSNMDFTYKQSESFSGVAKDQPEFPRKTITLQPRWTFRFRNGLDTNLNVTYSKDTTENSLSEQRNRTLRGNVKLQKNFDAEGGLRFLRFGKKGTGTTIDMTVDISYTRQRSERELKSTNNPDQPRGSTRISVAPTFSYQYSRNLRAGLQLNYSRNLDIQRDATTTIFGLGFDATLTF